MKKLRFVLCLLFFFGLSGEHTLFANELTQSEQSEKVAESQENIEVIINKKITEALELSAKRCYKQAYSILYQILEEHPCNLEALMAVANVLTAEGRYIEALMQIDYVLYLDSSNLNAKLIKATIFRLKNEFGPGALVYEEILDADPGNFYALAGLAYIHVGRGNLSRVNRLIRNMNPVGAVQEKDVETLSKYTFEGTAFDVLFYRYHDNQSLDTKKYFAIATDWICDTQVSWIYRHVDAVEPTVEGALVVKERLDSGQFDLLQFTNEYLDIGGGIGYAKISEDSSGNFITGNARANIYTDQGNFSVGSIYDVYIETAAALFFKIRTWTNYVTYTHTFSGTKTVGGRYFYVKYSDANHSNRVDLFTQYKLCSKTFQTFLIYNISYLTFASQPLSLFGSSLITGGHGYFDPKNALTNQVSLPAYYDRLEHLYFTLTPIVGYITYHMLGDHFNGIYYIGNALLGYRFTKKFIVEAYGEAGVYDLTHLHYTYSIVTGRVRLVF